MTLSYFAQHFLKIYDQDGNIRPLAKHELEFIKMIDMANQMQCDLQQVVMRDRKLWTLKRRDDMPTKVIIESNSREEIDVYQEMLRQLIIREGNKVTKEWTDYLKTIM